MKLSHLAPTALFAIAAASSTLAFTPTDVNAQSKKAAATKAVDAQKIDSKISETFHQIDDLIKLGQPLGSSFDELQAQVDSFPSASSMRARMTRYINEVSERVSATFISAADAAFLRQQFVDARLDRALAELERRARGGGWTPRQYAHVLSSWTARAEVFIDAPDPAQYRAKVITGISEAVHRAQVSSDIMRGLRLHLIQGRLEEARRVLLMRVAASDVSRADYYRVYELLVRRARLISAENFPG